MTDIYGRDLDDDEIESIKKIIEGEGYEAVMKDVSQVRKESYKKFYDWYGKKTGLSVHKINEELIKAGIKSYNKMVKPFTKCKSIEDVHKDFSKEINMTFIDTLGAMQDRGMKVILENHGYASAVDFLEGTRH